MKKKWLIGLLIYLISMVLTLAYMNYIVNVKLYQHGLKYSEVWQREYRLNYLLACIVPIVPLSISLIRIRFSMDLGSNEKTKQRLINLLTVIWIIVMVLTLTYLDYIVNGKFFDYGLQYSEAWHIEYGFIYWLTYIVAIIPISISRKSIRLFLSLGLLDTCQVQDIVYLAVWYRSSPLEQWHWTPQYKLLGSWTTLDQLVLSSIAIIIAMHILGEITTVKTGYASTVDKVKK